MSWHREWLGPRASTVHKRGRIGVELLEDRLAPAAGPELPAIVELQWQGEQVQAVAGEWLLGLDGLEGSPAAQVDAAQQLLDRSSGLDGVRVVRQLGKDGLFQIVVSPSFTAEQLEDGLGLLPGFQFVSPNRVASLNAIPNDTSFGQLWGLHNTGQTVEGSAGTADADIDAPEAWNLTRGSRSVIVAVVDTGIDYNHPDLQANMWVNPGEIAGNSTDDDGNGFIDDVYGWDFINNDSNPFDDHKHGTHVAGTIGATGNNSVGVVGVNWEVQLMALKVLDRNGVGSEAAITAALNYVTLMYDLGFNIRVTNNSYGGGGTMSTTQAAVAEHRDRGILFVAAAGNGGSDQVGDDNDRVRHNPSNFPQDNVIAVAALDSRDRIPSFSNWGLVKVDLGAPGVNVLSTVPGGGYDYFDGTSMAAPHVAGVAALAWSFAPQATYTEIRDAILGGVVPVNDLRTDGPKPVATGGRLNAYNTLSLLAGSISGTLYEDQDGDGTKNGTDAGQNGLTIELYRDTNGNGSFDSGIDQYVGLQDTTNGGQFTFSDVGPGQYIVRHIVPSGWVLTTPERAVTLAMGATVTGQDFGIFRTVTLSGRVIRDSDGDGDLTGEAGLGNVTVELIRDTNGNGTPDDAVADSTVSAGGTGDYAFSGVGPGLWFIREVVPSSYVQTAPAQVHFSMDTSSGFNISGRNFGNFQTVAVSGRVYEDRNGDGFETGDPSLGAVTVELIRDANDNGVLDDAVTSQVVTPSNGSFNFSDVGPGRHFVRVRPPVGMVAVAPAGGVFTFISPPDGSTLRQDFGLFRVTLISGEVYDDRDGDGTKDASDPGLNGVTVELWRDSNRDGVLQTGSDQLIASLNTSSNGFWARGGIGPGQFLIQALPPSGWRQTAPGGAGIYVVNTTSGVLVTGRNFGMFLNRAPVANPGGPYTAAEGGTVPLDGSSSSDLNQPSNTLTYTWDLDGDGVFGETGAAAGRGDETGMTPTFSAAGLDGPTAVLAALRVRDNEGAEASATFVIAIANAAPTVNVGGPYSVNEDGIVGLAASASDPAGSADLLSAAWDLDGDGVFGETGAGASRGNEVDFTPIFSAAGLEGPGSVVVLLRVSDDDGGVTIVPVTITINAVNDRPSFTASNPPTINEDAGAQTIAGWARFDPGSPSESGQTATYTVVSVGNTALFSALPSVAADGTLRYTPAANASGSSTFQVQVRDNGGTANGGSDTSTVRTLTITVQPINDAPVATDDSYSVLEDTQLQISVAAGVLANDADIDSFSFVVSLVSGPAHGTLTLDGSGAFTYQPDANYNGSDTFVYQVSDNSGASDVAVVSLTVRPFNDRPGFSAANPPPVDEDSGPQTIAGWASFNPGEPGEAGQTASYTVRVLSNPGLFATAPAVAADGTLTYTPAANAFGSATFEVIVQDSGGAGDGAVDTSAGQTFTVTVRAINDAPVAGNDSYNVNEDAVLNVSAPGVLANDSDIDGPGLSVALLTGPANGTLTLNADGSFVYTPAANFNGSDSFQYRLSDGAGGTSTGTVNITVQPQPDAPTAVDDYYTTDEDTTLVVAAPGYLGNDFDVDGNSFSIYLTSSAAHGVISYSGSFRGQFNYRPNANYFGPDQFTYGIRDSTNRTATAIVYIDVRPVNDAPIGRNDSYAGLEDTPLVIDAAAGLLANDSDVDDAVLRVELVDAPAQGTLELNSDGSFVYTPEPNFNGSVQFTYSVIDASGSSATAGVALWFDPVNDAPDVNGLDVVWVDEDDGPQDIADWGSVSAGPPDESGQSLNWIIQNISNPGLFAVSPQLAADGTLTFTPAADAFGSSTFEIVVQDDGGSANGGQDNSTPKTFTITVNPVNDAPVARDDSYRLNEDTTLNMPAAAGVLANDSDVDDSLLSLTLLTAPARGMLELNDDGSFVYTPQPNFNGTVEFTYEIADGSGSTATARVVLTIDPVNDAPDVTGSDVSVDEDAEPQVLAGWASFNTGAPDESGQSLSWIIQNISNPSLFDLPPQLAADGTLTFTPAANAFGSSTFEIVVQDDGGTANGGQDTSAPRTFTITINPVNDAPVLEPIGDHTITEGSELTFQAAASDIEGDLLTYSLIDAPAGAVIDPASGVFSWPSPDGPGTFVFTIRVTDSGTPELEDSETITVTVLSAAPTASITGPGDGVRGQSLQFTLGATDPSPQDQAGPFTFTIDWGDGSVEVVGAAGAPVNVLHVYTGDSGGVPFLVQVMARDKDGEPSELVSQPVTIHRAFVDGNGDLLVGGTLGNDTIRVTSTTDGLAVAIVNEAFTETFNPTGRIAVFGQAGHDLIGIGGSVLLDALLAGGAGNDTFSGGGGNDTIDGGTGNDLVRQAGNVNWTLGDSFLNGLGSDTLSSIERANLAGGDSRNVLDASAFSGRVTLSGGAGSDLLMGGRGDDLLMGGRGHDTIQGGRGIDRLVETAAGLPRVRFTLTPTSLRGLGLDSLDRIEKVRLTGTRGRDRFDARTFRGSVTLLGGAGADTITGSRGNDVLVGHSGNDLLWGRAGRDLLIGGAGADTLRGGGSDDILVAARTAHDSRPVALDALLREWSRTDAGYDLRIRHLWTGSGLNAPYRLNRDTIFTDDPAADLLAGGAGRDWFRANRHDRVADRNIGDRER